MPVTRQSSDPAQNPVTPGLTRGLVPVANQAANTPVAELFLPAAPSRPRPHRVRDLALLALAILCATAIATNAAATPSPSRGEGARPSEGWGPAKLSGERGAIHAH